MTSRLKIDVGQGRREEVQVQPTTTLGYVLEEVCKRRKLDPNAHDLRHQRKALDRTLTVRFAGLAGNAMLELVSGGGPTTHGECTVGLQLAGGGRQTAKLLTSVTLAEMIAQLAPDAVSPCIVYVGRAVSGAALASTTLLDLGISKGSSALLRLSEEADGAGAVPSYGGRTLAAGAAPSVPAVAATDPPPDDLTSDFVVVPAASPPQAASPPVAPPPAAPPPAAPPPAAPPTIVQPALPSAAMDAMDEDLADAPQAEMLSEALSMLKDASAAGAAAAGTSHEASILESLTLLSKYVGNLLAHPGEVKYRAIKKSNARFEAALGHHAAARQLLRLVGFEADLTGPEPLWVLPMHNDLHLLRILHVLLARELAHAPPPPMQATMPTMQAPPPPAPSAPPFASFAFPSTDSSAGAGGAFAAASSSVVGASNRPSNPASRAGPQMTLTEATVAKLKAKKLVARPELSVPRKLEVMRPGEGKAINPPVPDVSDDFYELHEDDLRAISLLGGGASGGGEERTMQTAAMRELEKLKALKEYTHARVRVRLPGGVLVEASYHPQEPLSHVIDLVQSCLIDGVAALPGYLFITPPRTELNPEHSLVEAGLVPAATAVLAWRGGALPPPFAALPPEELLKPHARELLDAAANAHVQIEGVSSDFPALKDSVAAAAAARAEAASAAAAGKRVASPGGPAGAAEDDEGKDKASKPKWLRM